MSRYERIKLSDIILGIQIGYLDELKTIPEKHPWKEEEE
jgi:hypothetical protein